MFKASKQHQLSIGYFAALALIIPVFFSSCASIYFYDVAVARNTKTFLNESKDLGHGKGDQKNAAQPASWISGQPYETVSITSNDGLKLVGYYLPSPTGSRDTVILAHGYSSNAFQMDVFAKYYSVELGFNVLMPDARGHGASGGKYIGFGWPDRIDYLGWIQWVLERAGKDTRIVLHGVSMGGATVVMVSGENLPPNVKAIVEDCGYTAVDAELGYQIKRMYKINDPAIIRDTSKLTKQRAGYSFEEASALEQVKKSKTPTLFIHGEADTFVPFSMVHELYDACPAPKELFTVPGAGHGMACVVDPVGYKKSVRNFLAKYLDPAYAPSGDNGL